MRGGIRPPFIDRKVMKAPKMTKPKLVDQVMLLQAYIDEKETLDKEMVEVGRAEPGPERWFGVAYIGWGSWEEDVFFIEADSPIAAIELFEDACKNQTFIGHGYDRLDDRTMWSDNDERILVYDISEHAVYRKTKWEKV